MVRPQAAEPVDAIVARTLMITIGCRRRGNNADRRVRATRQFKSPAIWLGHAPTKFRAAFQKNISCHGGYPIWYENFSTHHFDEQVGFSEATFSTDSIISCQKLFQNRGKLNAL